METDVPRGVNIFHSSGVRVAIDDPLVREFKDAGVFLAWELWWLSHTAFLSVIELYISLEAFCGVHYSVGVEMIDKPMGEALVR